VYLGAVEKVPEKSRSKSPQPKQQEAQAQPKPQSQHQALDQLARVQSSALKGVGQSAASIGASQVVSKTRVVVFLATLAKEPAVVATLHFEDDGLVLPSVIRRIPGHEIVALGGLRSVYLVSNEGNTKLSIVGKVQNLHEDLISDIRFKGNALFSVCPKEQAFKVTKFTSPLKSIAGLSPLTSNPTAATASDRQTSPGFDYFTSQRIKLDSNGSLD